MNNCKKAAVATAAALAACGGLAACYKWNFRMPLREYSKYALYMAALDDEICHNELESNTVQGVSIVFPPKADSLQYRYHLFLRRNRAQSRKILQAEIAGMEHRLERSRKALSHPKTELEVSLQDDAASHKPHREGFL